MSPRAAIWVGFGELIFGKVTQITIYCFEFISQYYSQAYSWQKGSSPFILWRPPILVNHLLSNFVLPKVSYWVVYALRCQVNLWFHTDIIFASSMIWYYAQINSVHPETTDWCTCKHIYIQTTYSNNSYLSMQGVF